MLKIAYHTIYKHPLPEGHRFPMEKYELLPNQLLHEGTCTNENFFEPTPASYEDILRVHTPEYLKNLKGLTLNPRAVRKTGFPLSQSLVEREIKIAGGTIQASEYALKYGVAFNIAGGTHHAYSGHGEAFCLLNDQAIAARYLQHKNLAKRILIIDLDVHQGNGTADIFKDDDRVFTYSMHGKNNYPFKKETSNLDLDLPDSTGNEEYLRILQENLPTLIKQQNPDFIFYLSGVDIISTDKLGKLGCTVEGCRERDRYVLQTCFDHKIPVQVSMGGGYSPDIKTIIEAHANTYRLAKEIWF